MRKAAFLLFLACRIVKECFIEGMPFTAGIVERGKQNVVGTKYCKVMKRLRDDGGAVILGVGNISEACMGWSPQILCTALARIRTI